MVYSTALATEIAIQLFGKAGIGYATVALTLLTVVFGEVLPKCLAVANAERFARVTLPLISGVAFVLKPIGMLMSAVNKMVLRACGVETSGDTAVSQPELRLMIEGSKESGAVEDYEQDMIEGVLDLELTKVEQILVPRVDLVAVEGRTTLVGLLEVTKETKYSRIPVYNETVDEIIGIVLTRELLEYADKPGEELEKQSVESIMEETAFIPESMTAMNALKLMRKRRLHMLVVVDEFGGTSGVVTLEDILETMVGEIYDEDDFDEVVEDMEEIKLNADGSYTVDAGADLDLVCDRLELQLEDEVLGEFATIAGYLCSQAGQIPDTGDVILVSQGERRLRFEVLEADERRLKTVRARNMTTLDLERMARKVEPS